MNKLYQIDLSRKREEKKALTIELSASVYEKIQKLKKETSLPYWKIIDTAVNILFEQLGK